MKSAIGIDTGGTHARVGWVAADGRLLAARRERTPHDANGAALLDWLGKSVTELIGRRPEAVEPPDCVGWALPGLLNPERTRLVRSVNLSFLEGRSIREELSDRLGLPVMLESDAAAAAWGEFAAAAEPRARFVFVTIGTGVGATVILDGAILRHTRNTAGQWGHLIVDYRPEAPKCACGSRGCLEALIGGPALERSAAAHHLPDSLSELDVACRERSADAMRIIAQAARQLAAALVSIAHIYAPDVIVVGGGVTLALPSLLAGARDVFRELWGDLAPRTLELRAATVGDHAGVLGAAQLARSYFGLP